MANFNIDQNGNMWIGTGVSNTFSTAQSDSNTKFYVESDGTIKAEEGSIGGVLIDANGMQSSNYDAATNTGWRIDNSQGTVFAYDIELILKSSNGSTEDDIPSDGKRKILIGDIPIYDFNGNLNIHPASGKSIIIHNGNPFVIKGETGSAQMKFDGAGSYGDFIFDLDFVSWANAQLDNTRRYSNPTPAQEIREFYFENDNTVIFRANEQNADVEFFGDIGLPSSARIYINGDDGNNGDILKRTATGMEWAQSTSGLSAGDGITIDSNTNVISADFGTGNTDVSRGDHGHNYDNFGSIYINGNQMFSGYGIDIIGSGRISVSSYNSNGYKVDINHTDSDHNYATGIQTISANGTASGSTVSFSGSGNRFFSSISASGNTVTFNTTSSYSGTPTFSGNINVGTSIFHPTANDGNGFIGWSDNRFNRLYASNGVSTTSDERLKENIENIPYGLDYLNTLRPVQFDWLPKNVKWCTHSRNVVPDGEDCCGFCTEEDLDAECMCVVVDKNLMGDKKNWGFVAQELITTPPEPNIDIELIDYDEDTDSYNMNYTQLIAPLVKAVQELSTQISDLTARVELLEG